MNFFRAFVYKTGLELRERATKKSPEGLFFKNGGAKEVELELLVSNLIAKLKSKKVNAAFFDLHQYLRKQKIAQPLSE